MRLIMLTFVAGCALTSCADFKVVTQDAVRACMAAAAGDDAVVEAAVSGVRSVAHANESLEIAAVCGESRKALRKLDPEHPCLAIVSMQERYHLALAGELSGNSAAMITFQPMMTRYEAEIGRTAEACAVAGGVS